jgi:hypothetical protein
MVHWRCFRHTVVTQEKVGQPTRLLRFYVHHFIYNANDYLASIIMQFIVK